LANVALPDVALPDGAVPKIRFACGLYDRMLPLYAGTVKPNGIEVEFIAEDNPRVIFDRMARDQAFDACEMSSSEFISLLSAGDRRFVAIPAFPSRVFRHGFITVNRKSGIHHPKDLAGKRIGVPLWTMTAAVWIRGHLMADYGVDLSNVTWVQGAINESGSHGNPGALAPVRAPRIETNPSGRSLNDLLDAQAIDAVIGTDIPAAIRTNPYIQRLFPNYREVERDYYKRTSIFPIMHLVVMRREVHEAHPGAAKALYQVLEASRLEALKRMRYLGALRYMLPWLMDDLEEIDTVFGGDPWPYGVERNRPTLQALMQYLVDQGIIARPVALNDIFVPVD
jgi:4,5-dihydroxyphthalate decarboxylase